MYKSELKLINEENQYTIPLYFETKEAEQVLCFLMCGSIADWSCRVQHYIYKKNGFIKYNKDFVLKNNKRKTNSKSLRIAYYVRVTVTDPKGSYSQLVIPFTFINKDNMMTLASYFVKACPNLESIHYYVREGYEWKEVDIQLADLKEKNIDCTASSPL